MDICGSQRCLYVILILSWWWQHAWSTSGYCSNFNQCFFIISSEHVCWLQWVCASLGLEFSVRDIPVIYWVVLLVFNRSIWMSYSCLSTFDITYCHYISGFIIFILFSHGFRSFDIRNVLLVPNESQFFRFQIGNAL